MEYVDALDEALKSAVTDTDSPGAVLYVGDLDGPKFHSSYGLRQRVPKQAPVSEDTIYDLASLTKVVATTTAAMKLRDAGLLDLERRVTDFIPVPEFRELRLYHLLTHTGGLIPYIPLYASTASLEALYLKHAAEGLERPPGEASRYSDMSFMLLGRIVELAAGDSLDGFCTREIFDPLGMEHTRFNPPRGWVERTAATEDCPWRKRVIVGEVHDEHAYAVGGVSGHAGLFSTAEDLARFSRGLLSGNVLSEATLVEMTTMDKVLNYPWRVYGWQMDPWSTKSIGFLPSRNVFGHTGWTGTSMWLDRDRGFYTILLGNTCHPSRERRDNKTFRRTVHVAVSKQFYPKTTNTHSGLDRVVREDFHAIDGIRTALLTNRAAVDQFGRFITDVFDLAPDPDLRIVYSPEHGLLGQAEAGEQVEGQKAPFPLVSLYGKRREPSQEELKGIDLFVVDLQDIGSRYYTYMATMRRCMAACARAGKPVLILDRPNPVGGAVLEGPIASDTSSDVCSTAIPIRHGMTMGELAVHFARRDLRGGGLRLAVNALDSWDPEFHFSQCSLPWTPPSPNIPTPETALLYVGMCLFEGTNLNEGRGTEKPFEVCGAPWLNAGAVIEHLGDSDVPGLRVEPITYTPVSIPGKASNPDYENKECEGIRLIVEDVQRARPFTTAVALLSGIRRVHGGTFAWSGSPHVDLLSGGTDLRKRIEAGQSASEIVAAYAPSLKRFDAYRPKLYAKPGEVEPLATA